MQYHYEVKFPVEQWLRTDIDLSWYPTEFPPTPWGEKRNWALQYPASNRVLSQAAIDFLNSINICPSVDGADTVNLFRGDPGAVMHIHQDPGPRWSLNYVWGNESSEMVWYKEGPDAKTRMWTSVTGRQAMSFEPEGMIEVDRVVMRGLQLVKIDTPHNVFNHGDSTRWAACVKDRTKTWTWEEAVKFFKPWIV